jgi:hypothetical protein
LFFQNWSKHIKITGAQFGAQIEMMIIYFFITCSFSTDWINKSLSQRDHRNLRTIFINLKVVFCFWWFFDFA